MKITYTGNSGFIIEGSSAIIALDCIRDTVSGVVRKAVQAARDKSGPPVYMCVSHSHGDHFSGWTKELVKQPGIAAACIWAGCAPKEDHILTDKSQDHSNIIPMLPYEKYCDSRVVIKTFGSTDEGLSFLIYLDGKTLFHAGDLNDWHWKAESTEDEIKEATEAYLNELSKIASCVKNVDIAMIPVDPRMQVDIDSGARLFSEKVGMKILFPMHYWGKKDQAKDAVFGMCCGSEKVTIFAPDEDKEVEVG